MKKRTKQIFGNEYFWILVITAVLFLSVYFKLSDLIYAITALIMLFYAIETYNVRSAIAENTELNTRPILTLEINFDQETAYIRNFSSFPGYNFKIADYHFEETVTSLGEVFQSTISDWELESSPVFYKDFKTIDVIPPGDKVKILEKGDDDLTKIFFTVLKPSPFKSKIYAFKSSVVYNDILNNNWKMTMGYSDGKIIATKPKKTLQEKGVTK
ncbi:MAG: hypothetical protein ACXVJ5_13510 [Flavisolibacter sp.]